MKILDLLIQRSVSEWSRCYYDYEGVHKIIIHAQNCQIIIQKIRDYQKKYVMQQLISESEQSFNLAVQQKQRDIFQGQFKHKYLKVLKSVQQGNQLIFKYHALNKNIVFLFLQMKIHQLDTRIDRYQNWANKIQKTSRKAYITILSNVYQQSKMIYRMCEVNLLAYKKVHKKHLHAFQKYKLDTPKFHNARVKRSMNELQNKFIKLQNLYVTIKQPYPKNARSQFYQTLPIKRQHQSISNYFFGLSNGISLSLIFIAILIYSQSSVSSLDVRFVRDFPVWRAVGYIILYLWVFALNTLVFEKYKIDYQLIFGFKQMTPRSAFALNLASGFTFVYMVLFIFYLLDLTDLIHSQSNIIYWFPLIIWATLIGYILNPLPIINFQGRIYFFKQILQTIASPFMRIHFNVIFISQQFISMILPFADIIYTFCYYIGEDLNNRNANSCQPALHTAEYFGFLIYGYRIVHSLKVAYQNKKFLWTREMFIVLRGVTNIFILFISLFSKKSNNLIIVWYVFIFPIFLFNCYVDLKWDWGLLEQNSPNKLLRKQIIFQPYEYYIIFGLNFIFRMSAILTLSENIIYELDLYPFYLIFIIAIIEIIRRFFWNIIKIEREHVLNCYKFAVKTDYEENQSIVINSLKQKDVNRNMSQFQMQLQSQRIRQEIENLNDHIQRKRDIRRVIDEWSQRNKQFLQQIESMLQQKYKQNRIKSK